MILSITLAAAMSGFVGPQANEVTVYNQGFGLVKETRVLDLKEGRQSLSVEDVAARIEPNSVGIRSLTDPDGFTVLEQNYQYDLISPIAILNKSVGQKVRFIRTIGNQRDVLEGTLISSPTSVIGNADGSSQQTYNGMVIRTDDGRIVLSPSGEVEVSTVPPGLISKPTLLWDIESAKAGQNTVELSYLTEGMNWSADYVLMYDPIGTASLKGWVTLTNQSGIGFKDAKLKLLAGDVARVQPPRASGGGGALEMRAMKAAPTFAEESMFEYHLYTMQRPATVANNEIKQLSLLEGKGIKVQKKLIIDSMRPYMNYYPNEGEVGTGDLKPQVRLEFVNSKDNDLGIPLPKGKIKIYQRDNSGSVQMLGEAQIDHTPKDEKLSLVVGESFDIRASRMRLSFHRIDVSTVEESFEISVRNRKEVSDTVHVLERHWGDWSVTDNSMDYTKADSNTMDFVVDLKAGEEKKITYTVRTHW